MTLDTLNVEVVGQCSFVAAFLAADVALVAAIGSAAKGSRTWLGVSKWAVYVVTGMLTVALMALLSALLDNDFRLAYVATHSEMKMPCGYKIAAIWAGQEGSLLLWAWMAAGMSSAVLAFRGRDSVKNQAPTAGILAGVCGLFCVLMLFAANPFKLGTGPTPFDGEGMNPLLQDPAMIIHPPALFLGYAGATIPFALMFGALLAGRTDRDWLASARRWAVASWLFLTAGILLGAVWAYYELGWGGYWGWDPVENASLLPWLTGTAVMHCLIMYQRRGMLKFWSAATTATTLALCFFAAFLGRSGIVQSVHAFPESPIGWMFLSMFRLVVLFSLGVIFWRRGLLKSEQPLARLVSLPSALILASILLVLMTLTVAGGTMYPAISGLFAKEGQVLKAPFYNSVVLLMGIALVGLMAAGPILRVSKDIIDILTRSILPGIAGVVAGVAAVILAVPWGASADLSLRGQQCAWTGLCVFVATFGAVAIGEDFVRTLARYLRDAGLGLGQCLGRFFLANGARYGAMTVHLGVLILVIGVLGSSLFKTVLFDPDAAGAKPVLAVGEEPRGLGRYKLSLKVRPKEVTGPNFTATEAQFLLTGPRGDTLVMTPQIRFYHPKAPNEQRANEVDFRSTLRDDVQVILEGTREDGAVIAQAIVFPLILWIWIGGCVMGVGAAVCVAMIRRKGAADEPQPDQPLPLPPPAQARQGAI
ncbi:MAG: cytochrome c biogenesis protein CcsA [Planctomycetota bacterium]|nr:cytochrome c biogenesis protein CcsA [Planctomycetota bacterium]